MTTLTTWRQQASWAGQAGTNDEQVIAQQVRYLDQTNQLKPIQRYKKLTYKMLNLQKGQSVLDVGCGTGYDTRQLAKLVGPQGLAIGIDYKAGMVNFAHTQTKVWQAEKKSRQDLRFAFHPVDVYKLSTFDFGEGESPLLFDACRADRVLMHLADPQAALTQIIAVLKPGGTIVVSEPDWETLVVNSPAKPDLTRKVLNYWADTRQNGWIGRQLPGLFKRCGLIDIKVESFAMGSLLSYDWEFDSVALKRSAELACEAGLLTSSEVTLWLNSLKEAEESGDFFAHITGFAVSGQKKAV